MKTGNAVILGEHINPKIPNMNTNKDTAGQRQGQSSSRQDQRTKSSTGGQASPHERRSDTPMNSAGSGSSASSVGSSGRNVAQQRGGVAVDEDRNPNASGTNHPSREKLDLSQEEPYWRENHGRQQFASNRSYDDFASAYRNGYEGFRDLSSGGGNFDDNESELRRRYETNKSDIKWEDARHASRAAWDRFSEPRQRKENVDTYGDPRRT